MRLIQRTVAVGLLVGLASGCSSDVRIGAVVSETGALEPYGKKVKQGIDLALQTVNARGGVGGNEVEVIYRDDLSNPEAGKRAVEALIEDEGVRIVLGAVSSTVTLAIAPICEENRCVLLSPTSSAPEVSESGDYIFRNYPSDVLEGTAMADLAKDLNLEKVVIFALDNDYGKGLTGVFRRGFETRFRQVAEVFPIAASPPSPAGTTEASGQTPPTEAPPRNDFAAMVARVQELKPDGIYVVAYFEDELDLLRQLHEAGTTAILLGTSAITEDLIRAAGRSATCLVYPQPTRFDPQSEDPAVANFTRLYRDRYGEDPDLFAAQGYDALMLVLESIKRNNSADPEKVRDGLLGIDSYQGAAGTYGFDDRGDVVRYPKLYVVYDGQSISYEQFHTDGGKLPCQG